VIFRRNRGALEALAAREAELRRERRLIDVFLHSTPDFVYFKDRDSRFVRVSSALAYWYGLGSSAEAIGRSDHDFYPPEIADRTHADELAIMDSEEALVGLEEQLTWPDGRITWVSTTKLPLYDGDQVIGTFGLSRDITDRKQAEDELKRQSELNEYQALHDALTRLPNRVLFRDRLEHALATARRERSRVAVAIADLDGFKDVNDRLGHHAGDVLLQTVADRLQEELRSSDTVARLGGDEFGLVLPHATSSEDVQALLRKLGEAIAQPVDVETARVGVGGSFGVSFFPEDGDDAESLLRKADAAMYREKVRR
jgi:diguanylate cyclase (GGDEF)-like protein/PAS domain S-box-containing protein